MKKIHWAWKVVNLVPIVGLTVIGAIFIGRATLVDSVTIFSFLMTFAIVTGATLGALQE